MEFNYSKIFFILKNKLYYILIPTLLSLSYIILYLFSSTDLTILFGWKSLQHYLDPYRISLGFLASSAISMTLCSQQIKLSRFQTTLIIFGLSIFIAFPFWIVPEVNPDASRFFTQAKYLETEGIVAFFYDWGQKLPVHMDQPIPPLIFGLLFKIFGEERGIIQAFNTIIFGLGVTATFLLARELWNQEIGLYSALFLMSFPHLLAQVPLLLVDCFSMSALTIGILGLILAIKKFKIYSVLIFVVFSMIALGSKLTIPIVFLFVIIAVALIYPSCRSERINLLLLLGIIAAIIVTLFMLKSEVLLGQLVRVSKWSLFVRGPWHTGINPISFFYQLNPAIMILVILSPLLALIRRDKIYIIILAWILSLVLTAGWTRLRYLIPIYPALAIASAFAINELIKNVKIRRYFVFCIMLFSITMAFSYIPYMQKFAGRNIMDAASYAEERGISEAAIITYFPTRQGLSYSLFSIFDYHYSGNLTYFFKLGDVFNSTKTSEPPEFLIIISRHDFKPTERSEAFAILALESNYRLIKRFDAATMGYWSPAITCIYEKIVI